MPYGVADSYYNLRLLISDVPDMLVATGYHFTDP